MSAAVRSSPQGYYLVDLACGIEQPFSGDRTAAFIAAETHNETHHTRRPRRVP